MTSATTNWENNESLLARHKNSLLSQFVVADGWAKHIIHSFLRCPICCSRQRIMPAIAVIFLRNFSPDKIPGEIDCFLQLVQMAIDLPGIFRQ